MNRKSLLTLVIFLFCINLSAQFFFIPIVIPNNTYVPFSCPPSNKQAYEYYQQGVQKIKTKELDVAIMYFKGSISKDSLFCDAYEGLAYCYRVKNQPQDALDIINSSLDINASNYSAQKTKGYILLIDLKDFKQSAGYFKNQNKLQPDNPLWLYFLTKSLIGMEMLDSAKAVALKTQMAYQKNEDENAMEIGLYLQGIIAYKEAYYEGAVRAFSYIHNLYKKDPEFLCFYGISLLKINNPDKKRAARLIKKAQKYGYPVDEEMSKLLE